MVYPCLVMVEYGSPLATHINCLVGDVYADKHLTFYWAVAQLVIKFIIPQ